MCVRDFMRRRCHSSSKRTFKFTKSRHSVVCHKGLCRPAASREARSAESLRREAVDLFCPEFLPVLDLQNCHDASELEVSCLPEEDGLLVLPMAPINCETTEAAALNGHSTLCALTRRGKSDCLESGLSYDDIEISNSQITSLGTRTAYGSQARSIGDAVVSHSFYPDPGSSNSELGPGKGIAAPQSQKAETSTFWGNSRQSNFVSCKGLPVRPHGSLGSQCEERPLSQGHTPDPTRKSYFSAQPTSQTKLNIDAESIQAPGDYICKFKFYEFYQVIGLLLERETETCYQLSNRYIEKLTENSAHKFEHNELRAARRRIVKWIFEVVRLLHLSSLAAAHAVSIFDRYLSQSLFRGQQDEANTDIGLAATACIWIAAKLEDSEAPDLSSIRGLSCLDYDEEKIREMEVSVLKSLGWRLLAATACEFLATMVAQLPALGLPGHLLRPVGDRFEEIIQDILSEVEFLAYQPSVVSISVMQCLLDECVPVHTASIMAAFHLALAVDVESEKVCHRTLVDLVVDPDIVCSLPSPDRVDCASSGNLRTGFWTSSNLDVPYPLPRLPVSALLSS